MASQPALEIRAPQGLFPCPALESFELVQQEGEAVAVVGPPGVGKSVLLRMAAGLEPVLSGTCERRSERLGFVFQHGGLVSNLTIRENILLPLSYRQVGDREAQRRCDHWIERFELRNLQEERPAGLSAQERRLSQLARVAALEVETLFLDELFLRLSHDRVRMVDAWLGEIRESRGTTVLMASLMESSVRSRANRCLALREPEKVESGGGE